MVTMAISELKILKEFSETLHNLDISKKKSIGTLLAVLRKAGFNYVALKIANQSNETIKLHSASGLSEAEKSMAKYEFGEGIIGMVAKEGEPIVVPDIQNDDRFLGRIKDKQEGSYYCFPIVHQKEVKAILSAFAETDIKNGMFGISQRETILQLAAPYIGQSLLFQEIFDKERHLFEEENLKLRTQLRGRRSLENIIGKSPRIQEVYEQIQLVAPTKTTVLITGANGTGKELVTDALHNLSDRKEKALVKVNIAALPENLLESELFGHEKGAFTGAYNTKIGRIERAEGGTLFLDEIGELSLSLQSKLLRFLQNREYERVGGSKTLKSNVRIITATNRNLFEEVQAGNFREDLFYRLNVFPIFMPSLKQRTSDILLLAEFFLDKFAQDSGRKAKRISTPAIDLLLSYHWPGNVRELENCIERAILICTDEVIRSKDLPPSLQFPSHEPEINNIRQNHTLPQAVANLEKEMIIEALKKHTGHQGRAAKDLDITERQMGYKMKTYAIVRQIVYPS
jgi:Nif-specific regulatory protein